MANELLQAALAYARRGIAVFPLRERGKEPLTPNGFMDAKTDPRAIRFWWGKWKNANIGIATGDKSGGLVVIDIDVDEETGKDGFVTLRQWEKEHGELPETWTAVTGRGGNHYYFHSSEPCKSFQGKETIPGIDVRANGGYVVAPPSIHKNGRKYEWEIDPDEMHIADVSDSVQKLINKFETVGRHESAAPFQLPEQIEQGGRNQTMFKLASSLQSQGLSDDTIMAAVWKENETHCNPPLSMREIETIVHSVTANYEKGMLKKASDGTEWHDPNVEFTDDGKVVQTIRNMEEAIEFDKALFGRIRYNTLGYSIYVYGNLPWAQGNGRRFREWGNNDDMNLYAYIEGEYGFKNKDKILIALSNVAHRHAYNPIQDLLDKCREQYHGGNYIENLLPDYLGIEKTEYTVEVMKVFMLGAIHRVYHPGCKFDYTPIFVGPQGCGKSTFIRRLALSDDWFNDNFNDIASDHAAEKLRGMWIVEMAELLATKRAKDVEAIKSFLTSRFDIYRPPYERRTENRPRSCVFAGTTNSRHFLTDTTGNRRFLPLTSRPEHSTKSLFDERQVASDFTKAWGEAMELYLATEGKPTLVLSGSALKEAEAMQAMYLEEDPRVGCLQDWLDRHAGDRVCVAQICKECFEMREMRRADINAMHDIMQSGITGWRRLEKRAKLPVYGSQITYERVKEEEKWMELDPSVGDGLE